MAKKPSDMTPRRKARKVTPAAAAEFEERQEADYRGRSVSPRSRPVGSQGRESASSQRLDTARQRNHDPAAVRSSDATSLQAPGLAASQSPRRARGGWTKADPYVKADGTVTRATTVYLPVALADRLRRFAFEADRKQSDVIAEALELFLGEREAR